MFQLYVIWWRQIKNKTTTESLEKPFPVRIDIIVAQKFFFFFLKEGKVDCLTLPISEETISPSHTTITRVDLFSTF